MPGGGAPRVNMFYSMGTPPLPVPIEPQVEQRKILLSIAAKEQASLDEVNL